MTTEQTDKPEPKKRGRKKQPRSWVRYTLTVPKELEPFAEQAKEEGGLSALLADCLRHKSQKKHKEKKQEEQPKESA